MPRAADSTPVVLAEVGLAAELLTRLQAPSAASGRDYDASGSTMKWIAPGSFTQGCTPGQSPCDSDEKPTRQVTLSGFWIAATETTERQWKAVTGGFHSSYQASCGENCPVRYVNWCEAVTFASARSRAEKLTPAYGLPWTAAPTGDDCDAQAKSVTWNPCADGYRLPTEAEWEDAARGGKDTLYAGGNEVDAVAWTNGNSGGEVHEVGKRATNGFGLNDMSGNLWEWAWDWYGPYENGATTDPAGPTSGGRRVGRGGGFGGDPARARVALRYWDFPRWSYVNQGFRLARGVPGRASPSR